MPRRIGNGNGRGVSRAGRYSSRPPLSMLARRALLELDPQRDQLGNALLEVRLDLPAFGRILDDDDSADDAAIERAQRRRGSEDRLVRAVEAPDRDELAVGGLAAPEGARKRAFVALKRLAAGVPPAEDLAVGIVRRRLP